jgi:hypothetical protein
MKFRDPWKAALAEFGNQAPNVVCSKFARWVEYHSPSMGRVLAETEAEVEIEVNMVEELECGWET